MNGILLTKPFIQAAADGERPVAIARCGTLAVEPCGIGIDADLWIGSDPRATAKAACDLFGLAAIEAVAWCALSAHRGGCEVDLRSGLRYSICLMHRVLTDQEQ